MIKSIDLDPAQKRSRPAGMELFEITPIILGGDPVDPANKTWLTRQQHIDAVRYWNRLIQDLRQKGRVKA